MKNVHVLPTGEKFSGISAENIYITSDEEIKYGDWCLDLINNTIYVATKVVVHNLKSLEYEQYIKKITLTTDQDLIKDDVQTIDDDFLEWFVKNPSCEEVETERLEDGKYVDRFADGSVVEGVYENYKIIIPKEEKDYTALLQPVGTKQTAVEWLYKNLKSHFKHDGDLFEVVQFSFEQAKEMEREQLNERYLKGIEVYNTKFKNK